MEFIDLKSQYAAAREQIDARMRIVLEHGQYIMGPEVAELEAELAKFCGARYCITVASGTEALVIALMALGIGHGDEVITTPFSFIATAEAIVLAGARPVFADIDPVTCNIDPGLIESLITSRTRAVMPVSLFGQPADMDAINTIALRHGLDVIEDAAQSFGASYRGARSCNLSTIGCTSFFPSKPLGCYGDGGALFTNNAVLAKAMREIRVHGQERRYFHTRIGLGGRMDTLQCAVVLAKLPDFVWELEQRTRAAATYDALLSGHVMLVGREPDRKSAFAQYTIVVEDRPHVQASLQADAIPTAVHYPLPIHLQPAYADFSTPESCPVAARMAQRVLSLPMGPYLTDTDARKVAKAVLKATSAIEAVKPDLVITP